MKSHLLFADEPIKEGGELQVNCGEIIPNATALFWWDSSELGTFVPRSSFFFCSKCLRSAPIVGVARKYVYGICNGQELKTEASAAETPERGRLSREEDR